MTFSMSTMAQSLASYLAPSFPAVTFYEDPNQQGTQTPAMFLQQRYSRARLAQNGRIFRTIGLDLTYLEDYNLPNMQQLYTEAAEKLDMLLETFTYTDGESTTLLRSYDRESNIDADGMHYKFEVRVFQEPVEEAEKMESMVLTIEVEA